MTLKSRLALVLFIFGLSIATAIVLIIDRLTIEKFNETNAQLLFASHGSLSNQINLLLNHTKQNIRLISSRTQLRELAQQLNQDIEPDRAINKAKIFRILNDAKKAHPWINNIEIYNISGEILVSSQYAINNTDTKSSQGLTLASQHIQISLPTNSTIDYLTDFTTVIALNNQLVGYIKVQIVLNQLDDLLIQDKLFNKKFTAQILAPNDKGEFYRVFGAKDILLDKILLDGLSTAEMSDKHTKNEISTITVKGVEIDYILSTIPSTNWQLALTHQKSNHFYNSTLVSADYFTLVVGVSTIAGLIGLFLAHIIVKPILHITNSAQAIIKGDLKARSNIADSSELGRLSYAINTLADLLIATNLSLEQKVNAKTLALKSISQEAVVDSQRKSEFLSNMSHEIRTAMNGVMGMVNLLSNTPLTKQQLDLIKNLLLSGENLLIIVNDILDYSKIQQNTIELVPKPSELKSLADIIYNTYIPLANSKGLVINLIIKPDIPSVLIYDKTRLNQVISNLMGNAIKFTESGSVNLTFSLIEKCNETCKIGITIKDTGIGIPESFLPKLFTPFAQETVTNQKHILGTGLGLAISKQLIELMQGKIWVESQLHEGTTFKIELDLGYSDTFELNQTKVTYNFAKFTHAKILLVEDNEINQHVALASLEQLGLKADLACNGLEAVKSIKTTSYDLILMDIQMPLMDGVTATREIRKISTLSKQPIIIALSASVLQNESNKYKQAGMQDVLAKPINMSDLKEKLHKWLKLSLSPQE